MTAQWVKFDGSDEQIAGMKDAEHGFIAKNITSQSSIMSVKFNQLFIHRQKAPYLPELFGNKLENFLTYNNTVEYLICDPHPSADMICKWARTGQPVWYRALDYKSFTGQCLNDEFNLYPFARPDKYEYSLTQFEEEV